MSHICSKWGHCEHHRNGFLQVRMAGVRKSNKKKVLKQKDGERNLHLPSCTPDVQAALRETRRIEWNKWMKFNAGVIFTNEEVRHFTEAGCEIYPMKRVHVDKNAYRKVRESIGWLQKLRDDRRTSHRFSSWRSGFAQHRLQLVRTDTFKVKKSIESCCTVFQLKVSQNKELQAETTVQKMQGEVLASL